MPGLISVNEFVEETRDDYNSPTTSTFVSKMPQCRLTIATLEETLDSDRDGLTKIRKAIKAIHNSGNSHVDNEKYLVSELKKLADSANREKEHDIEKAFRGFSDVTEDLSTLMKTLMQNINNIVMFPLETLLKGDLKEVRGDLKRPFDKAWKDYETKYAKLEKEKKQQAKEAGLIRNEITSAEIADDMEKERKMFQLQMCEYLIKVNEIKTKKGTELLQHLVEYYRAQTNYFQDGLKKLQDFGSYVSDLSNKLQKIKQQQDEERKRLAELKALLNKEAINHTPEKGTGYSLHQYKGEEEAGLTRSGHLLKKSEGKVRRVWQKRKCSVQAEGFLEISHGDESKPPTKVNLLTCQIKPVLDDKRCIDLVSYNRTYHFQAEDELDQKQWMSVLSNCKERALHRAFDNSSKGNNNNNTNASLLELQKTIIKHIQTENDKCCDCDSVKDATWLCKNFGVVVCIECSGIHRDLGVHISRTQSLHLDYIGTSQLLIARHMTNHEFNNVMEAKLNRAHKPNSSSSMDERCEFIRAKYVDKRFVKKTCTDEYDLLCYLKDAVNSRDLYLLLQVFGEGADLSSALPDTDGDETALHLAIKLDINDMLHLVDFLIQNMPAAGLDKQTSARHYSNTPLHICAIHDKTECMKLLLRSGADPNIRNGQEKTPLDIAQESGHRSCEELLMHALQGQKVLLENVNIDWNLITHDEGSTEVSEDDTMIDDRNGCVTPERKLVSSSISSRPFSSEESSRSRSSTYDSRHSDSYHQMPPPSFAPSICKKPSSVSSLSINKPGKNRAPMPPHNSYGTLPNNHHHHTRSPSDPHNYHTLNKHKRTPSNESRTINLPGAKLVIPPGEIPILKSTSSIDKAGNVKRPQGPPPPAPVVPNTTSSRVSNGQSNESLCSITTDTDCHANNPVPPPRKPYFNCPLGQSSGSNTNSSNINSKNPLRCRALYDCLADLDDELSFKEGDVIIVTSRCTEDENWMEGVLESDPSHRGMFPISFVHTLPES